MRWLLVPSLSLLLLLAPAALAEGERPPPGAQPFPTGHTTKISAHDGPVFYIDGPAVIPKGAEITVLLDTQIVGINGASLDVQGGLKVHGTEDHWVRIENVDFSPTREPRLGFHLDMVDLYHCRFVHGEDAAWTGEFTIENATMQRSCAFDVRIAEGTLKLMTIDSGIDWTIHAVSPDPRTKKILIQVRSSWLQAVRLTGACDATFRHSELKGGLTFENVTTLVVDGCDLLKQLSIHQGAEDVFKDVTLSKCNLFDGCTLTLHREPNEEAKQEKVRVDKFYFGKRNANAGITKKDDIARLVSDGEDEESRRVVARVTAPQKKQHLLVDYKLLRLRVAPVR